MHSGEVPEDRRLLCSLYLASLKAAVDLSLSRTHTPLRTHRGPPGSAEGRQRRALRRTEGDISREQRRECRRGRGALGAPAHRALVWRAGVMHGRDEQAADGLAPKAKMSAKAAPGIAAARVMHCACWTRPRAVAGGWWLVAGGAVGPSEPAPVLAALRLAGSDSSQAPSAPGCLPL